MSDYQQLLEGDQRLVILRSLKDLNGSGNDSVLQKILEQYGHKLSRDRVKTHLYWLNEQGLLTLDTILSTDVAKLTGRGLDVAEGLARCPGVGIPRPQ